MALARKVSEELLAKPIVNAKLASGLKVGAVQLKNRVVMSPLTRNRGVLPNDLMKEYYMQRATTGLIVSEGTLVEPQGTEWSDAPGIYNKRQIAAWKKITDGVHSVDGLIFAQLWHVGRHSHRLLQANQPVPAPSAVAAPGGKFRALEGSPGNQVPEAIEDPAHYVEIHRQAAKNAKEAGFDGVELHSASGYLCNQFLDSGSNLRTDKYGGSVENRARFTLETVDAIISVFGADRVGIKLSPSGGYNGMRGGDQELDLYKYLIKELDSRKLAYIHIARYLADFSGGIEVDIVKHIRPLIKNCKMFVNGGFSASEAEEWIRDGNADAIVFGRSLLSTPDFAPRAVRGIDHNKDFDFATFYSAPSGDWSKGYTDYPFYGDSNCKASQRASEGRLNEAPRN